MTFKSKLVAEQYTHIKRSVLLGVISSFGIIIDWPILTQRSNLHQGAWKDYYGKVIMKVSFASNPLSV